MARHARDSNQPTGFLSDELPDEIASHRRHARWPKSHRILAGVFSVALLTGVGLTAVNWEPSASSSTLRSRGDDRASRSDDRLATLPDLTGIELATPGASLWPSTSTTKPATPKAVRPTIKGIGPSPQASTPRVVTSTTQAPTAATSTTKTSTPKTSPTKTSPTKTSPTKTSPTKAPTTGAVTPMPTTSVGEQKIQAYITGYSYFDNTPPGSADISHPVIHQSAGGNGTYADPITVAVGHSIINGRDVLDWAAGTRFYIPNLRRYFIVEDTCGDGSSPQNGPCHTGYPATATTWLDIWIGGEGGSASGSDACMVAITDVWQVLVNPRPNYATVAGSVYGPAGCAKQFGNTAVLG